MIENGTLLQDRYLIKEKIGTGGMGAVYLAVDKRFDNAVAIKETFYKEDELGDAFEREARLLNALQHPSLPHVSDYFAEKDGYFLVMQFIEGEDLSDILKREKAFPVKDVLRWTDELLDALDYLHSQEPPIIHRDIKPHNLKLTPRGGIMLLDFGLAKVNNKDATEVSVFGYSRTYSPLEQIQGTGTDARSDIFALGATVYHLLTGLPPTNALRRASAIVNGSPDPLQMASEIRPEIPQAIASVIHSALALNPQHRFISAKAMRQALEYAVGESSNPALEAAATPAAAVPVLATQVFDSSADAGFPALEVFAEAKNSIGDEKSNAVEIEPKTPPAAERKKPATATNSTPLVVGFPARYSRWSKPEFKRIVWAAAAVLLFTVIAAALFFSSRKDSGEQTVQTPTVENTNSASNGASETTSKKNENQAQPALKSVTDAENSGKSEETLSTHKTTEGETEESAEVQNNQPQETVRADRTQRKKQAPANEENIVEDEKQLEDASQIEAVFSGRENRRNERRQQREQREIPDEMSEEEFEQLKREEKQNRRQRRNKPIPY